MNERRDVGIVEIHLLQKRGEEFGRIELPLIFPEELAAIDDVAAAQMEQVHGDQGRLGIVGEDIGVVAFGGGHLLLFGDFLDRVQQVVQRVGPLRSVSRLAGSFDAGLSSVRSCGGCASSVGGHIDLVVDGESGLLVEPGDVAALRAALERLLGDEALRSRLGAAAIERMRERFSWEHVTEATIELYADVLALRATAQSESPNGNGSASSGRSNGTSRS